MSHDVGANGATCKAGTLTLAAKSERRKSESPGGAGFPAAPSTAGTRTPEWDVRALTGCALQNPDRLSPRHRLRLRQPQSNEDAPIATIGRKRDDTRQLGHAID